MWNSFDSAVSRVTLIKYCTKSGGIYGRIGLKLTGIMTKSYKHGLIFRNHSKLEVMDRWF